ncbi:hypothetical protein [Bradyrhizobium sp. RT4b]|uniref:hypothetical protein n=1 Tax=unclassified Bradyrhizobium TaxID=2631580 RepID=UPI00339B9608
MSVPIAQLVTKQPPPVSFGGAQFHNSLAVILLRESISLKELAVGQILNQSGFLQNWQMSPPGLSLHTMHGRSRSPETTGLTEEA